MIRDSLRRRVSALEHDRQEREKFNVSGRAEAHLHIVCLPDDLARDHVLISPAQERPGNRRYVAGKRSYHTG